MVHLRQHEENVERLRQNEETEVQEGNIYHHLLY